MNFLLLTYLFINSISFAQQYQQDPAKEMYEKSNKLIEEERKFRNDMLQVEQKQLEETQNQNELIEEQNNEINAKSESDKKTNQQ
ncbi:MAG TPA: hypothetical protein VNJ08_00535 [Bacteriovoracaceae bacterium]|nr:hypothetical protein [Bacteriovoracaceae bacterium]